MLLKMRIKSISRLMLRVTFASKITILFTLIFAFALILTSLAVTLNLLYFYRSIPKNELNQTLQVIGDFISQGNEVAIDAISNINPNKAVEISIINENTGLMISTSPPFHVVSKVADSETMPPIDNEKKEPLDHAEQLRKAGNFGREDFDFYRDDKLLVVNGVKYRVLVFRRVKSEQIYATLIFRIMIAVNILGLISAYFTAKYISARLIKPINAIRTAAERITIEDLSRRIEISGPDDELRDLAVTFNAMIDRLEESFKKQNQFVSDASHELRTPISVIQGYANLIKRWGKENREVLQESIDSIKAETEYMSKLVKKLLFLARGDQNKMQIHKTIISLNQIAEETLKESMIMDNTHDFKLIMGEDVEIFADHFLIKQLLWIFIENSIKYSSEDTNIIVKVQKDKKNAFLTVIDQGIGILPEDLSFVFDRFYRVDKSRNKEIDGTGLGLSIAKRIVEQHGGEIKIKSEVGTGTEVTVRFRLRQQ